MKSASFAANATRTSNAASGCPAAISLFGSNFKLSSSFSSTYSKATLRKCTAVRLSLIFLNQSDNEMKKLKVSSELSIPERSEESRVGKECVRKCRSRGTADHQEKKKK